MRERERALIEGFGYTLAAVWIFGVSVFYYIRISFQVYAENQVAIENLMTRIFGAGG